MNNQPFSKKNLLQLFLNVLLLSSVSFLFFYCFYFRNEKMAYVESGKIMNEYRGAIRAKKEYDLKVKLWQSKIDTLNFDLQSSFKKYEKELAGMSAREKVLAKQLLDTKQKQFNDYQRAVQENARQEDNKLYKEIVSEVNAFLLSYGKEHNYKLILIANQSGTIAYAREGMDITAQVIEELNKENR